MLKYQIYQSQLKGSTAYGKFYARVVSDQTISVADIAEHMHNHHTPFSTGTIKGILFDAIACTKELLLEGKRVQWDNLASFGTSIEHTMGAATPDEYSVNRNVKSVRLIAQGIGGFSKNVLTGNASLRESNSYVSPKTPGGPAKYTVTLLPNNEEWGTVSGGGEYEAGSEIEIRATALPNYAFKQWSDGVAESVRTIRVEGDLELTAQFEEDGYL